MHYLSLTALAALSALAVSAQTTVSISYDPIYDNSSATLDVVACSYQLESQGFTTLGSLPDFPYIGGASVVTPSGSEGCATCWELSYEGNKINVLAIDYTDDGFNVAEEAFDVLTNGQAQHLGRSKVTATQVDGSGCGL